MDRAILLMNKMSEIWSHTMYPYTSDSSWGGNKQRHAEAEHIDPFYHNDHLSEYRDSNYKDKTVVRIRILVVMWCFLFETSTILSLTRQIYISFAYILTVQSILTYHQVSNISRTLVGN